MQENIRRVYGSFALDEWLTSYIVNSGNSNAIVRTCERPESEFVVQFGQKKVSCTCPVFNRLKSCGHFLAVLYFNDKLVLHFSDTLQQPSFCSSVGGEVQSGQKPGKKTRKGARSDIPRPKRAENQKVSGDYVGVRKSTCIKVCQGCKANYTDNTGFVIRHNCAMPFKDKDTVTGFVIERIGRRATHYFHPTATCIRRSQHHRGFSGFITIDSTLHITPEIRETCKQGDLKIVN